MAIEWKDGPYGFESLDLGLFTITVGWDSTMSKDEKSGYKYSYLQIRSKIFLERGECKNMAVVSAKKRLKEVLDKLT